MYLICPIDLILVVMLMYMFVFFFKSCGEFCGDGMEQTVSIVFDSLLAALLTCVDLILSLVILWWVGWELQALLCE